MIVFNEKYHIHLVDPKASMIQWSTCKSSKEAIAQLFKKNIHELEHGPVTQDINMIFKTWMTDRKYFHSVLYVQFFLKYTYPLESCSHLKSTLSTHKEKQYLKEIICVIRYSDFRDLLESDIKSKTEKELFCPPFMLLSHYHSANQ